MFISYNTEVLQQICYSTEVAIKHLGEEGKDSLQARHADIQAADNVFVIPGDAVSIQSDNSCSLTIPDKLTIIMIPNHPSSGEDLVFDWNTVSRVKIMRINHVE